MFMNVTENFTIHTFYHIVQNKKKYMCHIVPQSKDIKCHPTAQHENKFMFHIISQNKDTNF